MYHILFIHLSIDGHLGCFRHLDVVNNTTVNMGVHISAQVSAFTSFGYIELLDHMVTLF